MSPAKLWKQPPCAVPLAPPRAFLGAPMWFTFLFSKSTGKQASPGPLRVTLRRPVRPFTAALVTVYTRQRGRPRASFVHAEPAPTRWERTRDRRQGTHVGDKRLKPRRAIVNFANSNLGIKFFCKTPLFWWLNIITNEAGWTCVNYKDDLLDHSAAPAHRSPGSREGFPPQPRLREGAAGGAADGSEACRD